MTVPVREFHAQVVKSSKFSSEWYSFQTSQRPSKAPSAWSVLGWAKPRIRVTRPVGTSTRATPDQPPRL
ncbi:MAG TPA: hypothetical protein VLU96_11325 [Gaiellaceae bacterium]|nr:hypothetical protein [Gaiellaceae bacterium]